MSTPHTFKQCYTSHALSLCHLTLGSRATSKLVGCGLPLGVFSLLLFNVPTSVDLEVHIGVLPECDSLPWIDSMACSLHWPLMPLKQIFLPKINLIYYDSVSKLNVGTQNKSYNYVVHTISYYVKHYHNKCLHFTSFSCVSRV